MDATDVAVAGDVLVLESAPANENKAKGGFARAESLSKSERKEIARRAAEARWEHVPLATHGSADRPLRIGDIDIPCYVLEDGRRVVVQAGMITALGMVKGGSSHRGGTRLAKFVGQERLKSFCKEDLIKGTQSPVKFRTTIGKIAFGFDATILPDICFAVLEASKAGRLTEKQQHIADRCLILAKAFARVGITALVDEATGYQDVRDRQALQEILDQYLQREFAAWAKTFPDEFYKQIFRLRGWKWMGMSKNRPQCVAAYTKDIIYARLAPGILKELEIRNPMGDNGRRKGKFFQLLTEDIGHPALAQHMHAVLGLMRVGDSWGDFMHMIDRAFPKRGDTLQLPLFTDDQLDATAPLLPSSRSGRGVPR